ncbi:MAG: hypothetical protein KF878_26480 [Planctomycetes bacterium]|nr:hypothetical protein [Planctomycetota bacterium]
MRAGEVDPGRLERAARIGHPAARLACPGAEEVESEDVLAWVREVEDLVAPTADHEDVGGDTDEERLLLIHDLFWFQVGLGLVRALGPTLGPRGVELAKLTGRWVAQPSQRRMDEIARLRAELDTETPSGEVLEQVLERLLDHPEDDWDDPAVAQVAAVVGRVALLESLAITVGDWLLEPSWPEPAREAPAPVPTGILDALTALVERDQLSPERLRLAAYLGLPAALDRSVL